MVNIKLHDFSFYGDDSSSKYHKSEFIQWYRGPNDFADENLIFYTDQALNLVDLAPKEAFKVAWLVEPIVIYPNSYEYICQNSSKFDLILSSHKDLLKLGEKVRYYPVGGSWIKKEDWQEYVKIKLVSTVASNKNYTVGHRIRHQVINSTIGQWIGKENIFGGGYNPVDYKLSTLQNYMFQVAIENCQIDCYFTEKLIDCFSTATVPIYYGNKNISSIFDPNGIIFFNSIEELNNLIDGITKDKYNSMLSSVKTNFEIAKKFKVAEDRIFEDILKPLNLV